MKYFTLSEFKCKCCGQAQMDQEFLDKLDELRERCGFPLVITSGYRCPDYNDAVSSTGRTGPHTSGRATDIKVDRERAYILLDNAFDMGFKGIGVKQHDTGRFIHLDMLDSPRPTIWSYR